MTHQSFVACLKKIKFIFFCNLLQLTTLATVLTVARDWSAQTDVLHKGYVKEKKYFPYDKGPRGVTGVLKLIEMKYIPALFFLTNNVHLKFQLTDEKSIHFG